MAIIPLDCRHVRNSAFMNKSLSELLSIKSSNVNILKFICALLVIIGHAGSITGDETAFPTEFGGYVCGPGGFAVSVFFFFSGLYVTKSLARTSNLKSYIVKRAERIFPQLIVVVFLSAFVLGPVLTNLGLAAYFTSGSTYLYLLNAVLIPIHNLPGVFETLPYQTVNGPLWTLPVEFACYLMLWGISLVLVLISHSKTRSNLSDIIDSKGFRILSWIAGVLAILIFVAVYAVIENEFFVSVIRPVIIFVEGSMFYLYRDKIRVNPIAGLVAAICLIISLLTGWFSIGMILFLPYMVLCLTLGLPQIKADWTVFKLSYEMYLLGWPIQQIIMTVFRGNMSALTNILLTIPFDILLAYALYKSTNALMNRFQRV